MQRTDVQERRALQEGEEGVEKQAGGDDGDLTQDQTRLARRAPLSDRLTGELNPGFAGDLSGL